MNNKKEVLHSLFTNNFDKELIAKLRETIGQTTSLRVLQDAIENDICAPQLMECISRVAPICYKIGDKVFLKGETKGSHDFIGDDIDPQTATELFDMTQEMKDNNGVGYSFYVSTTDYFPFATPAEMIEVKKFLAQGKIN